MKDPNWLLSALSQSSAAIAAILGGFIFGRIIFVYFKENGPERIMSSGQKRETIIILLLLMVLLIGGLIYPLILMPVDICSYNAIAHKVIPISIFTAALGGLIGRLIKLVMGIRAAKPNEEGRDMKSRI